MEQHVGAPEPSMGWVGLINMLIPPLYPHLPSVCSSAGVMVMSQVWSASHVLSAK